MCELRKRAGTNLGGNRHVGVRCGTGKHLPLHVLKGHLSCIFKDRRHDSLFYNNNRPNNKKPALSQRKPRDTAVIFQDNGHLPY